MPRPARPGGRLIITSVRLPADTISDLDALAEQERAARPGVVYTRGDLVRELVEEGLKRRFEIAPNTTDNKRG